MTDLAQNPLSRRVGNTGMAVHPVAINGSMFGWSADPTSAAQVLDAFTGAGGNLISTADHYAGGRSETMIGAWLQRHDARDTLVIATKVGKHPDSPGLSAGAIRRSVAASRARLGVDMIDLLSLEGEDPSVPLEESMPTAAERVREGAVRHVAACGFTGARLREAVRIARRLEQPGISTILCEYNLLDREPFETELAPVALANDFGVLVMRPLAGGYLRGDGTTSITAKPGEEIHRYGRRGAPMRTALRDIAWDFGSTPARVALAWILARAVVAAPIIDVRDGRELLDLLPAVDLALTDEQLRDLDEAR